MNDNIQEVGYADESSRKGYSSSNIERKMSFLGRAVYSYDSRYYVSFNIRRDGNSDFGEYSRWSNFWSTGVSWNAHKEKFFSSELVKMLKFKASFGFTLATRASTRQALTAHTFTAAAIPMLKQHMVRSSVPFRIRGSRGRRPG